MKTIAIGLIGPVLDAGKNEQRWNRWRPSVALFQHEDLLLHRFEMIYQKTYETLARLLKADIALVSPETEVNLHAVEIKNPWDFEEVYTALDGFARQYPFRTDEEEYLVHITTGTHVAQICLYLLIESHLIPGKLIQTGHPKRGATGGAGSFHIIDLDLSKYDKLATRFYKESRDDIFFLKSGIETRNPAFNRLIERIEAVAAASRAPLLLMGPTGAGKSQLARRIYELKKARRQVSGPFVEVNCATIRGDGAMSTLFGHVKGAFTGAQTNRSGLLKAADNGVLLLDEIGELGLDEQAMLLKALEEGVFLPVGSDREIHSRFLLICGTNQDLFQLVLQGRFREDLLARINIWTFVLPGLRERPEDIEPNLAYELDRFEEVNQRHITFNKEARAHFLAFAVSDQALWKANFRDLNAALTRMATLAPKGRITLNMVQEEIERLKHSWSGLDKSTPKIKNQAVLGLLGPENAETLDPFDQAQLTYVLEVCKKSRSLSDAGRKLFTSSREQKTKTNDADRLRKYLARFGLDWNRVAAMNE